MNGLPALFYESFLSVLSAAYSRMSPGWHCSASQMASSVENRMALTLPVLSFERFTFATPTRSESSFRDIFRSAITRSSLSIIGIALPQSVSSESCCNLAPYWKMDTSAKNVSTSITPLAVALMAVMRLLPMSVGDTEAAIYPQTA